MLGARSPPTGRPSHRAPSPRGTGRHRGEPLGHVGWKGTHILAPRGQPLAHGGALWASRPWPEAPVVAPVLKQAVRWLAPHATHVCGATMPGGAAGSLCPALSLLLIRSVYAPRLLSLLVTSAPLNTSQCVTALRVELVPPTNSTLSLIAFFPSLQKARRCERGGLQRS